MSMARLSKCSTIAGMPIFPTKTENDALGQGCSPLQYDNDFVQ